MQLQSFTLLLLNLRMKSILSVIMTDYYFMLKGLKRYSALLKVFLIAMATFHDFGLKGIKRYFIFYVQHSKGRLSLIYSYLQLMQSSSNSYALCQRFLDTSYSIEQYYSMVLSILSFRGLICDMCFVFVFFTL